MESRSYTKEQLELLAKLEDLSQQTKKYYQSLMPPPEEGKQTVINPIMEKQCDEESLAAVKDSGKAEDMLEQIKQLCQQIKSSGNKDEPLLNLVPKKETESFTPQDTLNIIEKPATTSQLATEPDFDDSYLVDTVLNNSADSKPLHKSRISFSEIVQDRYDLLENLGEGGMGVVQRVLDRLLGREVALKRIKGGDAEIKQLNEKQQMMVWRLKREASLTSRLEHPNIVPLYDMQRKSNGEMYFTMRKIEGETLSELLRKKREGKVELEENKRLSIFLKICDAVSYAHNHEVVHRDLKPDNIMIGEFGEVYVMDWGIAKKLGESGSLAVAFEDEKDYRTRGGIGTLGYMAPEQELDASLVTPQADIYSLGRILRECYTFLSPREEFKRKLAFDASLRKETKKQNKKIQIQDSLEDTIPLDIKAIYNKATEEETEKRYRNVQELADDIGFYLNNARVSAREYTLYERFGKWVRRNRQKIIVSTFFVLVCIGFISYFKWSHYIELNHQRIKQRERKMQRFRFAFKNAKEERGKSENIKVAGKQEEGQKVQYLLNSLNFLNSALNLNAGNKEAELEKWVVGQELINLCCHLEDYQLASYVAKEMEELSFLSQKEKKALQQKVKDAETKTLKEHLARFEHWSDTLQNQTLEPGVRERILLEISKMQEDEIFEKLVALTKEGTSYFLKEEIRNIPRTNYYKIMSTALGWLENPKAGPFLLDSLKKMGNTLDAAPEKQSVSQIQYMVILAQALANSKALGMAKEFQEIRWKMGSNSLFWRSTVLVNQLLVSQDNLKEKKVNDSRSFHERGLLKLESKDYQGAIEDFTKALTFKESYQKHIVYCNRGLARSGINDKTGALIDFNKAIELNPKFATAYSNRGNIRVRLGDLKGAIEDYNKAIEMNPENVESYTNRGRAKVAKGELEEGVKDFDKALQINPRFTAAYNSRGLTRIDQKKFEEAIKDFTKAIAFNPNEATFYSSRGNAKNYQKNYDGAIEDYSNALRLNPKLDQVFLNRSIVKKYKKDLTGSFEDCNEALRLNPNYARAYFQRGLLKHEKKEYIAAEQDYLQALQLDQNLSGEINERLAHLYVYQGVLAASGGKMERAIPFFDLAIKLTPKDSGIYKNRGKANFQIGKLIAAENDFSEAFRLNPQDYEVCFTLGQIRFRMKNIAGAKEALKQYLKITKASKDPKVEKLRKNILKKFPSLGK